MEKRSLYDLTIYQECLNRIQQISADSKALWGTMDAAQMMAHCAEVHEVANGKSLERTPWFLKMLGWMVRRMVLSEKPYARNTRTHPQYQQTASKDFEIEKERLLRSMRDYINMSPEQITKINHPLFGAMSLEESGWSRYKHLDHHLTQFGA